MITVEQAKDSIRRLVKRKGRDYAYPERHCMYVKDGKPSCGIGIIMHEDYGVPIEELEKWDRGGTLSGTIVHVAHHIAQDLITPEALGVFSDFQVAQDLFLPYGYCAEQAGVEL